MKVRPGSPSAGYHVKIRSRCTHAKAVTCVDAVAKQQLDAMVPLKCESGVITAVAAVTAGDESSNYCVNKLLIVVNKLIIVVGLHNGYQKMVRGLVRTVSSSRRHFGSQVGHSLS